LEVGGLGMLEKARSSIPTGREISARDGGSHFGWWQVVLARAIIFHMHLGMRMIIHFGGRGRVKGRVIRIISRRRVRVRVGVVGVVSVFMGRYSTLRAGTASIVEHTQNSRVRGVCLWKALT
jgi:hypothetical protein